MKVKELELGKVYKCALSDQNVLVVKVEVKTSEDPENKETESRTSGKVCVMREGIPTYSLIELHDGQLITKS